MESIYTLPEMVYVGGATQTIQICLYTPKPNPLPFDANNCNADFSIVNLSNKIGAPILSKTGTIISGDEGVQNVVEVTLSSNETKNLYGKYVYQITVRSKSSSKKTEIPDQGIMIITKNINSGFLT